MRYATFVRSGLPVIQEESAAGGGTAVPPPCRRRRIGGYNRCRFRSQDEIPSRILHGKTLPPLHRRNDGVSAGPERLTIRKSAYRQRTPPGRRAGEGRNQGSLRFLVGRRGQRIAEAVPGKCVL